MEQRIVQINQQFCNDRFLYQFLFSKFMRINFDQLDENTSSQSSLLEYPALIDLQIQSPFYDKILKSVSSSNYKEEINSMKSMITFPEEITKFLHQQIEKEIEQRPSVPQPSQKSTFIFTRSELDQQFVKTDKNQENKKKNKLFAHKKSNSNHTYRKHKCQEFLPHEAENERQDLKEATHKPQLYSSKITKKYNQERMHGMKKHSVYENLYFQQTKREMKKEVKKELQEIKKKPSFKKKNKFKNYTSIYKRLDQILEKREKKYLKKNHKDQTTGKEFFKPDLSPSKVSYQRLNKSLSRHKSIVFESSSKQKQPEIHTSRKSKNILDQKVVDFFIELFHPIHESIFEMSLKHLDKESFKILKPFIKSIEEHQNQINDQETTVSSQKRYQIKSKELNSIEKSIFKEKFKKFYYNLNLYDRQILREKIRAGKKSMGKEKFQDACSYRPEVNVRSSSLDSLAKGHTKHIYYV